MKQLMMTALLALITFAASAQFHNATNCELRIRTVCIDENSCTVVSTGSWVSVPAMSTITPPGVAGCGTNTAGWEVSYAPSSGCTGSTIFTTNGGTMCPHGMPAWPPGASGLLPACACNMGNPVNVHFNYDSSIPLLMFDAH